MLLLAMAATSLVRTSKYHRALSMPAGNFSENEKVGIIKQAVEAVFRR
jgi:hypothetical protein